MAKSSNGSHVRVRGNRHARAARGARLIWLAICCSGSWQACTFPEYDVARVRCEDGTTSCRGGAIIQAGGRGAEAGTSNIGGAGAMGLVGGHVSAEDGGMSGSGGTLGAMPNFGGSAGSDAGTSSGGTGVAGEASSEAGAAGTPAIAEPTELAQGKPSTASTQQPENPSGAGNDGSVDTRWCSSSQALPQWWRVDLESVYELSDLSVQWEHPEREYWYQVEVSNDDKVFKSLMSLKGTGQVQTVQFPDGTKARYVRITAINTLPSGWSSFYEISVRGL